MKNTRVVHRIFAFLIMPVLGWLLGATIVNHFLDQYGPDKDPEGRTNVLVQECERHGPVSTHGFGYWHECTTKDNRSFTFLTPADVGKKVAIESRRSGRTTHIYRAAERPYAGWAWLALPFGILWLALTVAVARPVWPKVETGRVEYVRPKGDGPGREVDVIGGRTWVPAKAQFGLLAIVGFVILNTPSVATAGWIVVALIIGNGVRRVEFAPRVIVSPEGLAWRKTKLSWVEITEVRLTRRNVLVIQPRAGDVVRIGRFGDEQATRIHVAMGHFSQTQYTREGSQTT